MAQRRITGAGFFRAAGTDTVLHLILGTGRRSLGFPFTVGMRNHIAILEGLRSCFTTHARLVVNRLFTAVCRNEIFLACHFFGVGVNVSVTKSDGYCRVIERGIFHRRDLQSGGVGSKGKQGIAAYGVNVLFDVPVIQGNSDHAVIIPSFALTPIISDRTVFCYTQNGFPIDLQGCRPIKLYRDILAGYDLHHIFILYVFALKNRRKDAQSAQFSGTVEDHKAQGVFLSQPLLAGRGDHTAAIVPSVHGRRDPDLFVCMGVTVYCHRCVCGLVMKQQTLDGDGSVIHRFIGGFPKLITHLTAVAVNSVTHTVKENTLLPINNNGRKILQILIDTECGRCTLLLSQIPNKVITASAGIIIDVVLQWNIPDGIGKAVQCPVATTKDHIVINLQSTQKRRIVCDLRHIDQLTAWIQRIQSLGIFFTLAGTGKGVIQNVGCHGNVPSFSIYEYISEANSRRLS